MSLKFQHDGNALLRLTLLFLWLTFVCVAVTQHVVWRDEVRALSLSLVGKGVAGFFAAIHGEGHPALWFILLRLAHEVVARPEVLPAVSLLAAAGGIGLLLTRAPFSPVILALIVFSHIFLFEYAVIARNYGISVPLIFLFAILYRDGRRHGVLLGGLLFLLENCNLHSVIIAWSLLLFWGLELLINEGPAWSPRKRAFIVASAFAVAGGAACVVTVLPTFNDAVVPSARPGLADAVRAVIDPAWQFNAVTTNITAVLLGQGGPAGVRVDASIEALMSFLLFGSLLGFVRRPGAAIAGLASLIALSLFFLFAAPGAYRHDALWLVFLVALYWIASPTTTDAGHKRPSLGGDALRLAGQAFSVILLLLQLVPSLADLGRVIHPDPPLSRSRDLAALIQGSTDLSRAVVMGEPDYLIESLPFYADNPTYLVREDRFGRYVRFTRTARLNLTLSDLLGAAETVRFHTGRPVLILIGPRLGVGDLRRSEGVNWTFSATPGEIASFRGKAELLATLPAAQSDESFDVFRLR